MSQRNNSELIKQTGLFLLVGLLILVGLAIFHALQPYRLVISRTIFACFCLIIGLIMSCITAAAVFFHARLWQLFAEKSLANEQLRASLYSAQNTAAIFDATAQRISSGQVYLANYQNADARLSVKAIPKEIKQPSPLLEIENQGEILIKDSLLEDIKHSQRLLLVGGQNSGKTTLLKHIAKQRSVAGQVLILDSHNHAGKWNPDYTIVGHGRNYQAIAKELANLVELMDCRYKDYAAGEIGERQHELITVISDEFTTIAENIGDMTPYLLPLLTESRKVGIDFIVACHSETAGSLGLKGRFDLKKNFDAVLRLKNVGGKRLIDLDNGEDIINYRHCGAFDNDSAIKAKPINLIKDDFSLKLNEIMQQDLQFDLRVIDAYYELKNSGNFSWNRLSKIIYDNKVNGRYVADLKQILARHNIATSQ